MTRRFYKRRYIYAWACVGRKSGKILRSLSCQYSIWIYRADAVKDCPDYGEVRRVRIGLL